ncbi:MAG: hypothetical protein JXM79_01440 [Sedimentisphaerales bacterium]|nr:hypothetical protein [Sedimentisphaerales bacterium]
MDDLLRQCHSTVKRMMDNGQILSCCAAVIIFRLSCLVFRAAVVLFCLWGVTAWGQSSTTQPQIGYLYPAGGQQGTTFQLTVGGQILRDASDVYISGEGVHAKIIKYIRPLRNIQSEQRELLQERMKEVREKRLSELPIQYRPRSKPVNRRKTEDRKQKTEIKKEEAAKKEEEKKPEVKLPDHPLLEDLDNKSLRELAHIRSMLFFPRTKLQLNRQIAEIVLIEVTIDADARPGNRELRLQTRAGVTNPVVFQVGLLPEVRELEPNDEKAYPELPDLPKLTSLLSAKPLTLPVLLNGQIMPGDVDRFRFSASQGQQLVIRAHARSLIPYLADAVPGWFQATLALYDAAGNEIAFADDFRFDPDPVLFFRIEGTGEYELEIRDSIYRGREDFVYRISVSEQPFITQMFPLGGREGHKTVAKVAGWNLPQEQLPLDMQSDGDCIRRTAYYDGNHFSNAVPYAVDALPECDERESNNTAKEAQRIDLPKIINGRIGEGNDVDVFVFDGRAGDKVAAEVNARRLNSPLDSLLRLTDATGRVLEWNDDYVVKESYLHVDVMGLMTHHADSYLLAELPKNGTYYVHLSDTQHHGGEAFGYRLRVAPAEGDFALRVTPSNLNIRASQIVPIRIHALRKDGYNGPIDIVLQEVPRGFELSGGRVPAGCDQVRMTLRAPAKAPDQPVVLKLEGRANIGGQTIRRPVVAADDVMQAFLYRHLVPAREFLVVVQKARWGTPSVELAAKEPVRIPVGGSTQVLFRTSRSQNFEQAALELNAPPQGVTLHDVAVVREGLTFRLKADKDLAQPGIADNLIVEAYRDSTPKPQKGKPAPARRRSLMGTFPAIPIEIISR